MSEIINSVYLMDRLDGLSNLQRLKSLRNEVMWDLDYNRINFLRRLKPLISSWYGDLPDLRRDVFQPGEIEDLLLDSVTADGDRDNVGARFIEFVARAGYYYDPDQHLSESSTLCRSTAIHRFAGRKCYYSNDTALLSLFRIYNAFDVNFIDERGVTHYQVACEYGCTAVIERFLAHGRSANHFYPKACERPLHVALANQRKDVARLLLKAGADPNVANAKGYTPLHIICQRQSNYDLMEMFFKTLKVFEMKAYNDKRKIVNVNAIDKSGQTPLHCALFYGHQKMAELLLNEGANPNYVDKTGSMALHMLCMRPRDLEFVESFFRTCENKQKTVFIDYQDESGNTPLLLALRSGNKWENIELLLRRGADPNLANAEGLTPLRLICQTDGYNDETVILFCRIGEELNKPVQIDARNKTGQTVLHWALLHHKMGLADTLLRNGANPNLADAEGSTPLHIVCMRCRDFKLIDESIRTPSISTPHSDNTYETIEILLRSGADPTAENARGSTPMQVICKGRRYCRDEYTRAVLRMLHETSEKVGRAALADAEMELDSDTPLFRILRDGLQWLMVGMLLMRGCDLNMPLEHGMTLLHKICKNNDAELATLFLSLSEDVKIDARDEMGRTPLHLALASGSEATTELLLSAGASPHLADADGSTALHVACKRGFEYDDSAKSLLKLARDNRRRLKVDAKDKQGRTPLQWAVANVRPNTVDVLLARRANLASFVFPTDDYFGTNLYRRNGKPGMVFKLRLVYGALSCIESLEEAGYKLERSDAMAIMKCFAKNGLLDTEATDHEEKLWLSDEKFTKEAKEAMINSSLSLYDLILLEPEDAAKKASYMECYNFMKSRKVLYRLDKDDRKAAALRLCERTLRGFFYNWALFPFWKLIHYQLPLEICEMIVEGLSNKDLYNICLVDAGQSDEDSEVNAMTNALKRTNSRRSARDTRSPKRLKIEW